MAFVIMPMTTEEIGIPLDRNWPSTIKRLVWGFLVGATIGSLPLLGGKVNSAVLLLLGEILGWPGAVLALVVSGWNNKPFTLFVYFSANFVVYVGLTYFFLSRREKRKRLKQESPGSLL
jgi:hypothetical protein